MSAFTSHTFELLKGLDICTFTGLKIKTLLRKVQLLYLLKLISFFLETFSLGNHLRSCESANRRPLSHSLSTSIHVLKIAFTMLKSSSKTIVVQYGPGPGPDARHPQNHLRVVSYPGKALPLSLEPYQLWRCSIGASNSRWRLLVLAWLALYRMQMMMMPPRTNAVAMPMTTKTMTGVAIIERPRRLGRTVAVAARGSGVEVLISGALGMVSELRTDELPSRYVVVEDDRICGTLDLTRIGRDAGVVSLADLFPETRS